jgi:hypothetical protein
MYYFEIGTLVLFLLISVKDIFYIRHFASKGGHGKKQGAEIVKPVSVH